MIVFTFFKPDIVVGVGVYNHHQLITEKFPSDLSANKEHGKKVMSDEEERFVNLIRKSNTFYCYNKLTPPSIPGRFMRLGKNSCMIPLMRASLP